MPDIEVSNASAPVLIPIYAVTIDADSVTIPNTDKTEALLRSWLAANHYAPTAEGWVHESLPEAVSFERALGHCATFPA